MQRHFEAERSGSFEVNSEHEFCWEFDRQVARLRALYDLVDISCSAAIILALIDPVACKPSNLDILGVGHNRRQASGKCELNDTGALGLEQPVRRYNDGLRPLLGQTVKCGSEIIGPTGHRDTRHELSQSPSRDPRLLGRINIATNGDVGCGERSIRLL